MNKKYLPSKMLESIFLYRNKYTTVLRTYNPRPCSYQLIHTLVQLNEVVFDEDYITSEIALSAAKKWLDENAPMPIKSAGKQ